LQKSREHKDYFSHSPLSIHESNDLAQKAGVSLQKQQQLEAADKLTFDQFLAEYLAS
jgi:glutamate--cysteine ligase